MSTVVQCCLDLDCVWAPPNYHYNLLENPAGVRFRPEVFHPQTTVGQDGIPTSYPRQDVMPIYALNGHGSTQNDPILLRLQGIDTYCLICLTVKHSSCMLLKIISFECTKGQKF